jgi:tRNA (guanine-N7-)-methyltransferase
MKLIDPFVDPTTSLNPSFNPYVKMLQVGLASGELPVLYGPALNHIAGRWREKFSAMAAAPRELILEIGCHKGDVLIEMAQAHPEKAFIGMDITFKRVVKTAQKIQKLGLKNVISVLANAEKIELLFAEAELNGVVLFFPDPWILKKNTGKKRLFNQLFAHKLDSIVAARGFVWLKTDALIYYENAQEFMNNSLFFPEPTPRGIPAETYLSCFERSFLEMDVATHHITWVKRPKIS